MCWNCWNSIHVCVPNIPSGLIANAKYRLAHTIRTRLPPQLDSIELKVQPLGSSSVLLNISLNCCCGWFFTLKWITWAHPRHHRRARAVQHQNDEHVCNVPNDCTAIRIHHIRPGKHWYVTVLDTLHGRLKLHHGNWLWMAVMLFQPGKRRIHLFDIFMIFISKLEATRRNLMWS